MGAQLFISYKRVSEKDGSERFPVVSELSTPLKALGIEAFVDSTHIETFTGITDSVVTGIEASHATLLYFTADYVKSEACMAELRAAYIAAQQNGWKPAERIFVLNPETTTEHLKELPVDLRDISCAFSEKEVLDELPRRIKELDGVFGKIGLKETPAYHGRTLIPANRFVGRTREMWDLHDMLTRSDCSQVTGQQGHDLAKVHGMGGIGKSLLAEEYAIRFGAAYPCGIFWLQAHGSMPKPFARSWRFPAVT